MYPSHRVMFPDLTLRKEAQESSMKKTIPITGDIDLTTDRMIRRMRETIRKRLEVITSNQPGDRPPPRVEFRLNTEDLTPNERAAAITMLEQLQKDYDETKEDI